MFTASRWGVAVLLGVLLAGGVPGRAAAQESGDEVLQHVQRAFTAGSARVLLEPAAERLEIGLFGASTLYSRSQALYVMQEFFRQYPPRRFTFQEPSKANGSWFTAGSYWYEPSGRLLRVYVRLRQKGRAWELREIRIEEPGGA